MTFVVAAIEVNAVTLQSSAKIARNEVALMCAVNSSAAVLLQMQNMF